LYDRNRPPVAGHQGRFARLEHLGDYIIEGPRSIHANDTEGPAIFIRLEQTQFPVGDKKSLGLYVTQGEWAPSPDAPLIRHVVWHRGSDRLLTQHGSVLFPDVTSSVHRMDRADLDHLEALASNLGSALGHLTEHDGWTLNLRQRYVEGFQEPVLRETSLTSAARDEGVKRRVVDFLAIRLDYMVGWEHEAVDAAFQPLWDFLSGVCNSSRGVECDKDYFGLSPQQMAVALRHADSEPS
jgi:hypothetical protein